MCCPTEPLPLQLVQSSTQCTDSSGISRSRSSTSPSRISHVSVTPPPQRAGAATRRPSGVRLDRAAAGVASSQQRSLYRFAFAEPRIPAIGQSMLSPVAIDHHERAARPYVQVVRSRSRTKDATRMLNLLGYTGHIWPTVAIFRVRWDGVRPKRSAGLHGAALGNVRRAPAQWAREYGGCHPAVPAVSAQSFATTYVATAAAPSNNRTCQCAPGRSSPIDRAMLLRLPGRLQRGRQRINDAPQSSTATIRPRCNSRQAGFCGRGKLPSMESSNTPIVLREASRRYGIHAPTLSRWADRGIVTVLQEPTAKGKPRILDELSVARAAATYSKAAAKGSHVMRKAG